MDRCVSFERLEWMLGTLDEDTNGDAARAQRADRTIVLSKGYRSNFDAGAA